MTAEHERRLREIGVDEASIARLKRLDPDVRYPAARIAAMLGVSRRTVYRWFDAGMAPVYALGGRYALGRQVVEYHLKRAARKI